MSLICSLLMSSVTLSASDWGSAKGAYPYDKTLMKNVMAHLSNPTATTEINVSGVTVPTDETKFDSSILKKIAQANALIASENIDLSDLSNELKEEYLQYASLAVPTGSDYTDALTKFNASISPALDTRGDIDATKFQGLTSSQVNEINIATENLLDQYKTEYPDPAKSLSGDTSLVIAKDSANHKITQGLVHKILYSKARKAHYATEYNTNTKDLKTQHDLEKNDLLREINTAELIAKEKMAVAAKQKGEINTKDIKIKQLDKTLSTQAAEIAKLTADLAKKDAEIATLKAATSTSTTGSDAARKKAQDDEIERLKKEVERLTSSSGGARLDGGFNMGSPD